MILFKMSFWYIQPVPVDVSLHTYAVLSGWLFNERQCGLRRPNDHTFPQNYFSGEWINFQGRELYQNCFSFPSENR